jgi:hypothetical protein
MSKKSIIICVINEEAHPNYVVRKAFGANFNLLLDYDWYGLYKSNVPISDIWDDLKSQIQLLKPDYLFMQIQNPNGLEAHYVEKFASLTKVINWTGDVRGSKEWMNWFVEIGKHCFLTLFSNECQAEQARELGINADYLQIGFDNIIYNRQSTILENSPEIVFCANEYGIFDCSHERVAAVLALKEEFGERFLVFGNGWHQYGIQTRAVNNVEESALYGSAKIAISISNFCIKRYFSDRLLRIMGVGGAIALSHNYPSISEDFFIGEQLDVFNNVPQLINTCHFYLDNQNEPERALTARSAYEYAHNYGTWQFRCEELLILLKKYHG